MERHESDMLVQFGRNIRRLREMRGLSQARLAEMVGYKSRTSINKIEMGKTDIGQKNIAKIADALGVTSADILYDGLKDDAEQYFDKEQDKSDYQLCTDALEEIQKLVQLCKFGTYVLLGFSIACWFALFQILI